ncbi:hypothetical protein ELQ57_24235 [Salmonella enterica subsp. enterica serovar Teko]|nr:hypothetical protein [Salmonella enterica]EAA7937162.1 hypothetical protein [Salmonella enterica subsp. enterica serovar Teko]EBH8913073.1 hypothetical protein [Salmonella enterica subsp. enterica serovar Teko]EBY9651560.1 hypothetical protein [Salmonella enterica subsp. enterica serovar Teko]ECA4785574.1 hypothetical protein [Salmonella enterica subsp. enterica serovar Teko]
MPQAARDVTHREAGTTWRMSMKSGAVARHPKKGEAGGYTTGLPPLMRRSQSVTGAWHPFLQQ